MTKAIAVLLKTESGDDYVFAGLSDNLDSLYERIAETMGDELEYVWSQEVEVSPWDGYIHRTVTANLNEARGNV